MKLSKILSVALLGAVSMTTTAMAAGTTAGTTITNQPTLNYSMGDIAKIAEVDATSYVVDKVINFTLTSVDNMDRTIYPEMSDMVQYKIKNIGNSEEAVILNQSYGSVKDFAFATTNKYVDVNGNGVLDDAEKVTTNVVSSLAPDTEVTVWLEVSGMSTATELNAKTTRGLDVRMAPIGSTGVGDEYTTQSVTNALDSVDIVFADADRNNQSQLFATWTSIENPDNVKLTVIPLIVEPAVVVTYDPINGTSNPKMIPGAKIVKRWSIKNNTLTTATNVKFSVAIDSEKEIFSTSLDNTWMAGRDHGPQYIWNSTVRKVTDIEGVIDGDVITYTIPEIQAGVEMVPHLIVELK